MAKSGLRIHCPNCNRTEHQAEANYCLICGSKLKSEPLREFYLSLSIPNEKISLELLDEKILGGFPFFLRKSDCSGRLVEVVLVRGYPKGTMTTVDFIHGLSESPFIEREDIILNSDSLSKLISRGFEWFHHSEMDTLW